MADLTSPGGPTAVPVLPLASEGYGSLDYWKKEIEAAAEKVKELKDKEWDPNIQSYMAKPLRSQPTTDTVVVPRDFAFVEQKSAQLFFQTPEVHLTARKDATADAAMLFQAVINYYLSEDEIDALATMNEVAFDALCPSALMCTKIGVEVFTDGEQPIETGNMIPDPENPQQEGMDMLPGQVLGIGAPPPSPPMIPETQQVPNIVHVRYFWERISPAAYLCPQGFSSSNYDKATWQGFKFKEGWSVLRKRYKLPEDMDIPKSKGKDTDELKLKSRATDDRPTEDEVTGVELWYRAAYYDPTAVHPEKFRQLVLLDGYDKPLVHRDSPYQKWDSGKLIGMKGNPIHVGALRYVSDTAFPPSECSISRQTNEELNKGRTQMMVQRDRNMPMRMADPSRMGGEPGLQKIRENNQQGIIPVTGLDVNNPPIVPVAQAQLPRENFEFNAIVDSDLGQIWAMGRNQTGQESENGDITATEVSKIDEWASTRLDKERRQILRYFIKGVRKLASLIQMFASQGDEVELIGDDMLPRMQVWNKDLIQGEYVFKINPDSSIRIDQTQAQSRILKLYELLGKDPNVQRTELLKEVCRQWNLDPAKIIITQPPEPKPQGPSVTLKGEDISIQNPNFPLILSMLITAGFPLDQPNPQFGNMTPVQLAFAFAQFQQMILNSAQGGMMPDMSQNPMAMLMGGGATMPPGTGMPPANPMHPGAMPKMEHLSKHHADETGERSGPKVN